VNRLPLDNAILKFQYHGVSQLLTRTQDKRCVCGTGGQGHNQQSVLLMRRFLAKLGYCQIRARCLHQSHRSHSRWSRGEHGGEI